MKTRWLAAACAFVSVQVALGCACFTPPVAEVPTSTPGPAPTDTPAAPPGLTDDDRAAIYAAVVRQLYTVDHTFGEPPNFPVVYLVWVTDDSAGDIGAGDPAPQVIPEHIRAEVVAALTDLPAELVWVGSFQAVPREGEWGAVAGGGGAVTLGNINLQEDGTVQVPASLYVAPLVATGLTYVLEQVDGLWQVTGTTGPMWIS